MHSFPLIVTDLADQAVILPLVLAVLVLLIALGETRAAGWWMAAMTLSLGGTLLAKIVFIPCGHLVPGLAVRSPSGHTAAAAAAYSGLMMLAARTPGGRLAALGLSTLIVGLIAVTRVALHAHTLQETLVGAAIGAMAPLLLTLPQPLFVRGEVAGRRWVLVLPLLVIPLMLGQQMNAERWIADLAWVAARSIQACDA